MKIRILNKTCPDLFEICDQMLLQVVVESLCNLGNVSELCNIPIYFELNMKRRTVYYILEMFTCSNFVQLVSYPVQTSMQITFPFYQVWLPKFLANLFHMWH